MARQGYYNAAQETSRRFLQPDEWAYWIEGEPAARDLRGIGGRVGEIRKGTVRDGGSLADRACSFRSWSSYQQEAEYLSWRWAELGLD